MAAWNQIERDPYEFIHVHKVADLGAVSPDLDRRQALANGADELPH